MHNLLENKKNSFLSPDNEIEKKLFEKNLYFTVQFSPDLGKFPRFQKNLKCFLFFSRSGEKPKFWGKINY